MLGEREDRYAGHGRTQEDAPIRLAVKPYDYRIAWIVPRPIRRVLMPAKREHGSPNLRAQREHVFRVDPG